MIKYPNGKVFTKHPQATNSKRSFLNAANRGMDLENDINKSNEYYRLNNIALITKRPTPINVVKVDYSKGARITDAYFEKQSTTDYNGVYKGHYIDFEAKQTDSTTSFPLANIHEHQFFHLENVIKHGGISFFIIRFTKLNETYLIDTKEILTFKKKEERKSIPYEFIKEYGYNLKEGYNPRLNYIEILDNYLLKP